MDIAQYRKKQGMSQAQFAAMLTAAGYAATQSLISQWERGEVNVTPERAVQLEDVTAGALLRAEIRPDIFSPPKPVKNAKNKR